MLEDEVKASAAVMELCCYKGTQSEVESCYTMAQTYEVGKFVK